MSRDQYRARGKKVQKLSRDGLVEQDMATGQEERISQRTADVSFGPDRPQEQAAGRASPQRTALQGIRRKQPRPSPPPEPVQPISGDTADVRGMPDVPGIPDVPEIAPAMRQANDISATAPQPRTDGASPSSSKRRQQKKANRLKSDVSAQPRPKDGSDGKRLHFEQGNSPPSDVTGREESEPAALRGTDTMFRRNNEALKRQLLELCRTYPDQVRQTAANRWGGLSFELPKKWLKVSPPRVLSPAQRAVLDKMNENKHKGGG